MAFFGSLPSELSFMLRCVVVTVENRIQCESCQVPRSSCLPAPSKKEKTCLEFSFVPAGQRLLRSMFFQQRGKGRREWKKRGKGEGKREGEGGEEGEMELGVRWRE